MLQKNIDKINRKQRVTWMDLYERMTASKIEKERKNSKKHKKSKEDYICED